jgi:hypothetical protein
VHTDPPEGFPAVLEAGRVFDLLLSLVDKSLVLYDEDDAGRGRYRLLETVRQYAGDRAREAGDGDAAGACHVESMLRLAVKAEAGLQGAEQARWLRVLDAEHDNRRAALDRCARRPELAESGLRIAAALQIFWDVRGALSEGRRWLEGALAGSHGNTGARGAAALAALGALAGNQGEFALARWCLEESLRIRRVLGNTSGIVASLGNLGIVLYGRADYAGARARFEEALAIKRAEGGEPYAVALLLGNLGVLARNRAMPPRRAGSTKKAWDSCAPPATPAPPPTCSATWARSPRTPKTTGRRGVVRGKPSDPPRTGGPSGDGDLPDQPGPGRHASGAVRRRPAPRRGGVDAAPAGGRPAAHRVRPGGGGGARRRGTAAAPGGAAVGRERCAKRSARRCRPTSAKNTTGRSPTPAPWPAATRSPWHSRKGVRCRLSRRSRWRGAVRNRVNKPAPLLKRLTKRRVESAKKIP